MKSKKAIICLLLLAYLSFEDRHLLFSEVINPSQYEKTIQETKIEIKNRLIPILSQFCGNSCHLIDIKPQVEETIQDNGDIGFEGLDDKPIKETLMVISIDLEIEIDKRVSEKDRERLNELITNHLKNIAPARVSWVSIDLPKIDQPGSETDEVKRQVERKVEDAIGQVIRDYCPDSCVYSYGIANGKLVTSDEALKYPPLEVFSPPSQKVFYHVEGIDVGLSIDENLSEKGRDKILNLLKAKTQFIKPIKFNVEVIPFPETFSSRQERTRAESSDPYGLDKLRQMLTLFRDLAGTKEIISNSSSRTDVSSKDSSSSSSLASSSESQNSSSSGEMSQQWFIYILLFLVVGGGIVFIILRFSQAGKDASFMMNAIKGDRSYADMGGGSGGGDGVGGYLSSGGGGGGRGSAPGLGSARSGAQSKDYSLKLKVDAQKEELMQLIFDTPKVAKATFARILLEDGPEETAKLIHVLGKVVIFELLNDQTLHRELYALSEYYHKSDVTLTIKDEEKILSTLKNKFTANEIKIMTEKVSEQFDFLHKLDAGQIYTLISDENARVQSIVLTQLTPAQRKSIFKLYQGDTRANLLKELCKADAIPKEYLANVARALGKKVVSKPEFDTQNLRASDILLELLERSSLDEQRQLMSRLVESNPDAARAIKLKLVTVEMIPFLKDGHLLELVLGMEREDLLSFLVGTRAHIRNLLLSHAPSELAESWMEDMENISSVEENQYRMAEMKILGKIRSLASSGTINLLDTNDIIFANAAQERRNEQDMSGRIDKRHIVA